MRRSARDSFMFQPVAERAAIVVAGPLANFVLAIVIFAGVFMLYGKQTMSARVDSVQPDSAAAAAGFKTGDLVVAIDGRPIENFADMQRAISGSAGETLAVTIDREGSPLVLQAKPALKEVKDNFGNVQHIGVLGISRSMAPEDLKLRSGGPAAGGGDGRAGDLVRDRAHARLHRRRHRRPGSGRPAGGPIRIAQMSGQVASFGFVPLIQLAAVLSVSIGLLNLFPIPLLDGGHLLFYIIEGVRGRPLSERAQEIGFRIGLAIVLMLMIFATFNDIVHLATS